MHLSLIPQVLLYVASCTPGCLPTPEDFPNLIVIHLLAPFPTITSLVSSMHFTQSCASMLVLKEDEVSYRAMPLALLCGSSITKLVPELHPTSVEQAAWQPQAGRPPLAHASVLGGKLNLLNLGHIVEST